MHLTALDLFSCVGGHAIGLHAAGFTTSAFIERDAWRRSVLAHHFPGVEIFDDVRTYKPRGKAFLVIGGPPCQRTSVAAAIHGKRDGASLWPEMLRIARASRARWVCVEQPPGNSAWEAEVSAGLAGAGYRVARLSAAAADFGALHRRRRVFIVAHASLPRLEVARAAWARAVAGLARGAIAGNPWVAGFPAALRVADGVPGRLDRHTAQLRRARIEAIGDSNPPVMAQAVGLAIREAEGL